MKPNLLTIGHSYVVSLNRSVMRELHRRGNINVTVLSPNFFAGDLRPISIEPEESDLDVRGINCSLTSKIHFFYYNQFELNRFISEKKWDYGFLWEEPYIVSGFQVARCFSKNQIPFSIFTNQNIVKRYPFPFSWFEKQSLQKCSSLWGCGSQVLETFRKKNYQGAEELIPYFVNIEKFNPFTEDQKKHAKRNLGITSSNLIGFMGRLTKEKGCLLFLKILENLDPSAEWQALILGAGPLETDILKWISDRQMQNRVFLKLIPHNEVPAVLPAMDLLVCPSQTTRFWREQFGRMLIEAFAGGVPVVASDSGEIPYVVGDAGLILPESDEKKWFTSVQRLLNDKQTRDDMRSKGLLRAKDFSSQTIAQKIEESIFKALS